MVVQRTRMLEIATELKRRGCFLVVGGPWITASEHYFDGLADVSFFGEADESWPSFLREWAAGEQQTSYRQAERTDVTKLPVPRYDLFRPKSYLYMTVQLSRGCPFTCEFCDITVIFGRKPRYKTSAQLVAELDALYALGHRTVFFCDDNFIANKQATRGLLTTLLAWQEARGFPLTFFTQASLDLADDTEMLDLMSRARFTSLFIGIETPNEESLAETHKSHNLRPTGTLVEKIHRIQAVGIEVWAGMIVGFDSDDSTIFGRQRAFLTEARIMLTMLGMLSALPGTALHERLQREGRLDTSDHPEEGTNVIPLTLTRKELRHNYLDLLVDIFETESFFDRFEALFLDGGLARTRRQLRRRRMGAWARMKFSLRGAGSAIYLFRSVLRQAPPDLRRAYIKRMLRLLTRTLDPDTIESFALKTILHAHSHILANGMRDGRIGFQNSY